MPENAQSNEKRESAPKKGLWGRLSGPVKIGLIFAAIAIVMAVIGLIRESATNPVPLRGVLIAIVIPGGTWGLVSWAIATAVVEVERDVAAREEEGEEGEREEGGSTPEGREARPSD